MTPTATQREALARVVSGMLAYRGYSSPEALERSYAPDRPPYSGKAIRRIIDRSDVLAGDDELKLLRVAGMLRMPPRALILVVAADILGLERLDWKGETDVCQFITDIVREVNDPPRNRRASDRKRHATGG